MPKISRFCSLILIVSILFGTVACTSSDISRTTQDFFKAVNKGEYDKAAYFVNIPGGSCLTCHNEVRNFAAVMSPGQLETVNVKNLEVNKKDEVAKGYIEFTTTLGKVSKTIDKVTFTRDKNGLWQINYRQIARLLSWREREPDFASSYEDIPNKAKPEPKTKVVYELTLPQPGQIIPITENPLKATEKDAKPHIFWSNSVKPEPDKVTFSPAVIAFKPDNEDPAVYSSTGIFSVGGWLVNNTDRRINRISNVRITILLDSKQLGRVIVVNEIVDLSKGMMQYREYNFKSGLVDTNTNMNKVRCIFEFSAN